MGKYKNPNSNKLSSELVSQLNKAVEYSGYPVQLKISDLLRDKFYHLQEEWAYKDSRDNSIRTIDILAELPLWMGMTKTQPRIRPNVNLLIECKQSRNPLVFFLSKSAKVFSNYPQIAGIKNQSITVRTDDDKSSWVFDIDRLLGIYQKDFVIKEPKFSTIFSKLIPGSKPVLSGEEIYTNTVLPLVDAVNYLKFCEAPSKTALYFDLHMIFPIAVIDAPMIGIEVSKNDFKQIASPWVRLLRWETAKENMWDKRGSTIAIDFIHIDFFKEFIEKHFIPFVADYSKLVVKHQNLILKGKGFIKGMRKDSWNNLEARLENK